MTISELKHQADEHLQRGDFSQAIKCLLQAYEQSKEGDTPPDEVVDLIYSLGNLHRYAGSLPAALGYFHQCVDEARELGQTPWVPRAMRAAGEVCLRQERLDDAIDAFRQAVDLSQEAQDRPSVLITEARLARALSDSGRREEATQLAEKILNRLAEHSSLSRAMRYAIAAQSLLTLGVIRFRMGQYRAARRFLQRAIKLLAFTRAQLPRAEALRLLGIIDSETRNFLQAIPTLYEAWEIYRTLHYDPGRFDTYWSLGITYLDMGDLRNARICLKQAERIARDAGLEPEYGKSRSKQADIETREGNYAAAFEMYHEDLRITEGTSDRQALGYCHWHLGKTYLRLGQLQEAQKHLLTSADQFASTQRLLLVGKVKMDLAELYLLQNDHARAAQVADEARQAFENTEDPGHAALLQRLLGKIDLATGNPTNALSHFEASVDLQLQSPPTRLLAETRFEAASACQALGDREGTLTHLRNAVALAEALGSRDIREAALRQLESIDLVEAQTLKLVPYLPANAIQEMVNRWVDIDRQKSRVTATIMFVDMRGYTSLSGQSESFDLIEAVEAFLSLIVRIISQHGGVVDKFIGDSAMVTFGLPAESEGQTSPEQGARMAVWAGMEIIEQLRATARVRTEAGAGALHASIGINTGEVVAGCFGPLEKRDYTVIGYQVNLASRLQSLASSLVVPEDDRMLLSDSTYQAAKEVVEAIRLPAEDINLKGIDEEEIRVWKYRGKRKA